MAILLLKKSYRHKDLKIINFNDLWNAHGIFTTMRVFRNSKKILFFNEHITNLIKSSKIYNIYRKNLKKDILNLVKLNLKIKKKDQLFRIALNSKIISISSRNRIIPKLNFKLKLVNYKRVEAKYKNLRYKKILNILNKLNTAKFDIALHKNKKLLETGTSNLLFIKNNKVFSPKKYFYKGTTLKFFSKKIKINFADIFLKNLMNYDEIIIIGSGKGVVSTSSIENTKWKRKSVKFYNKFLKIFNAEIKIINNSI